MSSTAERKPELILPTKIQLMGYRSTDKLPTHPEQWISEFEHVGVRAAITFSSPDDVRILVDGCDDVTDKFPELTKGFAHIAKRHQAVIDGMIIFGHGKNKDDKQKVTDRINAPIQLAESLSKKIELRCKIVALDLLHRDGEDLRSASLITRKNKLAPLITKAASERSNIGVIFFEELNHQAVLERAKEKGFRAIILKRQEGLYVPQSIKGWSRLRVKRGNQTNSST